MAVKSGAKQTKGVAKKTAKKAVKQSPVKKVVGVAPKVKMDPYEEVMMLAHQGTQEALDRIAEHIENATDEEFRDMARLAYIEAELNYYEPKDMEEEHDVLVAKMIHEHEDLLTDLSSEIEVVRFDMEKLAIEREVDQMIGVEDADEALGEEYVATLRTELQDLEEAIAYEARWIEAAESLIKHEKYQEVPESFFDHYFFDGEVDESDDEEDEDWNDDGCCGGTCRCHDGEEEVVL